MKTTANVYLIEDRNSLVNIQKDVDYNKIGHFNEPQIVDGQDYAGQHLYITLPQSDLEISKIKQGDWYLHKQAGEYRILQCNSNILPMDSEKIIATTNKYLIINIGGDILPLIPKSFIEHFISEYNKGNIVESVDIELEEYDHDEEWSEISGAYETYKLRLKLNPQNEISIIIPEKKKDSWNRDEVIELCKSAFITGNRVNDIDYFEWEKQNL